jgi:hypothetical protein
MHHAPSPWQDLQIISLAPSYRGDLPCTKGFTVSSFYLSHWSFSLSHPLHLGTEICSISGSIFSEPRIKHSFLLYIFSEVLDFGELAVREDDMLIPIFGNRRCGIVRMELDIMIFSLTGTNSMSVHITKLVMLTN